jgi:hypothetical protein
MYMIELWVSNLLLDSEDHNYLWWNICDKAYDDEDE